MNIRTNGVPIISPDDLAGIAGSQWFDAEQTNGGQYGWMKMINNFNTTVEDLYAIVILVLLCSHFYQFYYLIFYQFAQSYAFHSIHLAQCK